MASVISGSRASSRERANAIAGASLSQVRVAHFRSSAARPSYTPGAVLVSVVVRSYKRKEALKELVARLREQRHPSFEIVILEQSDDSDLVRHLESIGDPRVRVVVSPPMSPPAARNEAIRHSSGEVILLIDDDDLPIGDDWIDLHAENYADPRCMGVVGRLVGDPANVKSPRFPRLVRHFAMRYTFFKDTRALAYNTVRKEGIDFLIGSNASMRRSLIERIGGWDEGIPMNEEQSFAIKFAQQRRDGEKFVFDPRPLMWRRTDVPGGLDRRRGDDWHMRELEARLFYYEHVVGYYFERRYRLLRPLFWLRGIEQVLVWIWDSDNGHRSFGERLSASLEVVFRLPKALRSSRFSVSDVRRVPEWH
jgi:glycosyltransferase involved in cell wall biosynthesis